MNLAERLARLAPRARTAPGRQPAPAPTPLPPPPEAASGGRGPFFRRRTALPLTHVHGARPLAAVAALETAAVAALCDAAPPAASGGEACVFFDTETTSLGCGAGVYVFLAGFAAVEEGALLVDQIYLTDPSGEPKFLEAVAARIAAAPLLVSFFGRGFDERRLEDRYRFARMRSPFVAGRHADLGPLARSLWRSRLPSCALGSIEPARLGFRREGDLPSAACPEAYFRSLGGDRSATEAIFRHNLQDLLSTAVLAVEAVERATRTADPAELLGLARHHLRRARPAEALALLARAEDEDARTGLLLPAERRLLGLEAASLLKRAGRHAEAAVRWRALAAGPTPSLDALVELAKHAEHRECDLGLAERCAVEALSLIRRRAADLAPARREALERDLARRLERIARKAACPSGRIAIEAARGPDRECDIFVALEAPPRAKKG